MRSFFTLLAVAASSLITHAFAMSVPAAELQERAAKIKPKVLIMSMFSSEGHVWYGIKEFNVLAQNISVPGLSPVYPNVHCTADGDVCQLTIGEAEINAASTVAALVFSPKFDFTTTYFMIAGIAGVNPEVATTTSVTFARYAVQVALQYEFSQLEIPRNFTTGYIPLGAHKPDQYPTSIYGTEVFEFNKDLQHLAAKMASKATLKDTASAKKYRANYGVSPKYAAGAGTPGVVECDVGTSDVYWSGRILGETFSNFTTLITNGSGLYCTTAQEDNGTAEVLVRAAFAKLVDFARVICMRTASDFDREYPGEAATTNLWWRDIGALEPAIENIYVAGIYVVQGILDGWDKTFQKGVKPSNYIGDIFATLGGTPDFGPYTSNDNPVVKRSMHGRMAMRQRRIS